MPRLLESATPFSSDDLRQVDSFLPSSVIEWAEASAFIPQPDMDMGGRIKNIATFHALYKAHMAAGRLSSFREAVALGLDLHTLYDGPLLLSHSPKGMAGKAAGHLAVAKLLARWYDLQPGNFTAISQPEARDAILRGIEGVGESVCTTPRALGITTFMGHDVFVEAQREAEAAVGTHGPEALEPYITFPEYPIE